MEKAMRERPKPSRVLSVRDMEEVAKGILSYKAWCYFFLKYQRG